MTEGTYEGTWTVLVGDEEQDAEMNTRIVVCGNKAWHAGMPETEGKCAAAPDGITITSHHEGTGGRPMTEMITAWPMDNACLSGTVNVYHGAELELSEPCLLFRDTGLATHMPMVTIAHADGRATL